jgi:hypothetical protein
MNEIYPSFEEEMSELQVSLDEEVKPDCREGSGSAGWLLSSYGDVENTRENLHPTFI